MSNGWIGVDLDGTLAEYKGWKGATVIGNPIPAMVDRVNNWLKNDIEVKIFTARVNPKSPDAEAAREAIMTWCVEHLGCELDITHEKDYGMIECWDDRAISVIPNTGMPGFHSNMNITIQEEDIYNDSDN